MHRYPKPSVRLAYGTAGFRARADILDSTFFRMGMLAVLRSRSRDCLAVGLMVTASHNAEPDNGIKLVDCDGGMLAQSWEVDATKLANAEDEMVEAALAEIAQAQAIGAVEGGVVLIGRDTRPHSERLARLALEGIELVGGTAVDCGLLTTPQLHHIIRHRNGKAGAGPHVGPVQWASETGYFQMLTEAYAQLVPAGLPAAVGRGPLWVDAACGVGAPKVVALQEAVGGLGLTFELANGVVGWHAPHISAPKPPMHTTMALYP